MFKELLIKKLIQSKLGNVPKEEVDKIVALVTKNPKLFEQIAKEIKHEMDVKGKDQMAATMAVMPKYQGEIKKLMK